MSKLVHLLELSLVALISLALSGIAGLDAGPAKSAEPVFPLHADEDEFTAEQIEFFENKVRPLLVEHCYDCHGPDADPPEGGLSLVSRKSILAGGDSGPGIDLDYLEESNILSAVQYGDLFEMPPDSKLGDEDVEIFRQWIMQKAPWPSESDVEVNRTDVFDLEQRKSDHWCWQPVSQPDVPTVNRVDWPRDPIDNFVLSRLEQEGLTPAQPAARQVWLRRVTFDITGLPPSPSEIEDFLNDDSPTAYDNVVARLLASPAFGERWARHWMDLVRYAETCGHEFDYPLPNAFQYRDYLIRAFNTDVPYNDLVTEHIAGDLIGEPRRNPDNQINESVLGTGFWFLGEAVHAPVDVKGDEAGRVDNQIDVFSKTFLGLTVACARCHDHKFDAISAADYYGVAGFLQSSRRQDVMLDPGRQIEKAAEQAFEVCDRGRDAVSVFLESLPEADVAGADYERYMKAAVLFLQKNRNWLLPKNLVIEGESLATVEKSGGNVQRQDVNGWSDGGQICWTDAGVGDFWELELESPVEGRYEILAVFTRAQEYGIFELSINGEPVGELIDLYSGEQEQSAELSLGEYELNAGPQRIRLKISGKNDKAEDKYMAGIDYVVLRGVDVNMDSADPVHHDRLAAQFKIDASVLDNWITAIASPETGDIDHPFFLLRKSAESTIDLDSRDGERFYREQYEKLNALKRKNDAWFDDSKEFASAAAGSFDSWKSNGPAFDAGPGPGLFNVSDPDFMRSLHHDGVHSGRYGSRFQGVIRSPTFEITHPVIQYHVFAKNARIRLIVDGFRMDLNNALLFEGMSFSVDTGDKWKWVAQSGDLKNHIGHRAFIEIIDQGDGFVSIDEIRFADRRKPDQDPSVVSINSHHPSRNDDSRQVSRDSDSVTTLTGVTGALARSMQLDAMFDFSDKTILDTQLFNFMARHRLLTGGSYDELETAVSECQRKIQEINSRTPVPILAIGMVDGAPENEYVFIRGNHKNLGDMVPRGPITALNPDNAWTCGADRSGRLELARNIVSENNPLTRRVVVNRLWHHLTGRGIVASVDNFGVLGDKPTHPELLDYLANELVNEKWSIKQLIRRIVLSQTYRMSSGSAAVALESDPGNELLHSFRVRRLQGEAIRDSMLAISQELDRTLYGPGVPVHLTPFMQGRGRPGKSGPLDGNGRRSIYTEVRRNFLSPMMLAFDTPIPFNAIGRRNNSNVPAQALIMMNDPLVVQLAAKWAQRMLDEVSDVDERIRQIVLSALGRLPTDDEILKLREFLNIQARSYGVASDSIETDHQLWTDLCHVVFNLKEFIYIK